MTFYITDAVSASSPADTSVPDFSINPVPSGLGKGKRARVPNKRYSDLPINDKSLENGELKINSTTQNGPPPESNEGESELPSVNTPLITVKKTSSLTGNSPAAKKLKLSNFDISNPTYLKPLKRGWKRELVYR